MIHTSGVDLKNVQHTKTVCLYFCFFLSFLLFFFMSTKIRQISIWKMSNIFLRYFHVTIGNWQKEDQLKKGNFEILFFYVSHWNSSSATWKYAYNCLYPSFLDFFWFWWQVATDLILLYLLLLVLGCLIIYFLEMKF